MEIDISRKVSRAVKYSLAGLLGLSILAAGIAWHIAGRQKTITLYDAAVSGSYIAVRARTAGTLESFSVPEGTAVKTGDALAKIRVRITPEEIAELEKNVATMQNNLTKLEAGISVTRPVVSQAPAADPDKQKKMKRLYDVGAISAAEYNRAAKSGSSGGSISYTTKIEPASAETIERARRQLSQAEAALKMARGQLGETTLAAPYSGTVFSLGVAPGDELRPGQPVIAIGDIRRLVLVAPLSPEQAAAIKAGLPAAYKLDGRKFIGVVLAVETAETVAASAAKLAGVSATEAPPAEILARPADKERTCRAIISIPAEKNYFPRPGAMTSVKISL